MPFSKTHRCVHWRWLRHRRAIALGYAARARGWCCLMRTRNRRRGGAGNSDAGGKAESFALDVTRREDCVTVAKEIASKVGQVSILVNNAASPGATACLVRRKL